MIPNLVTVRYRTEGHRGVRLYIPVLPVLLVLSPLLVLGGLVACVIFKVSPGGALRGVGRVLWALPGTRIEFEDDQMAVLVSVR